MASTFIKFALLALSASRPADGHVSLHWPVPFDEIEMHQDRSPIASNYPCHTTNFDFSDEERKSKNTVNVDQEYQLAFFQQSYAVHNGGTCQLSITLDDRPNIRSIFKTFYTIEGGCPGWGNTNSNGDAVNQTFKLPSYTPKGKVTLAWSWFPATSANYEMYMNCAPIYVPNGSDDYTEFNRAPDMLVANIPSNATSTETGVSQRKYLDKWEIPHCSFAPGGVVPVPAPGSLYVNSTAAYHNYATQVADACACGTIGPTTAVFMAGQLKTATIATITSYPDASTPNTLSIFSVNSDSTQTPSTRSSDGVVSSAVPTPSTANGLGSASGAFASAFSAAPNAQSVSPVVATTSGTSYNPCSSLANGQIICNGSSQYGVCNWESVVWRSVSAGMVCENGVLVAAKVVRTVEVKSL